MATTAQRARRARARRTREEVRARIVAAAVELVRHRSYAELSVEGVMREAGIGRTIFYRHFDDIADLLVRASREAIDELYAAQPRPEEIAAGQEPEAIRRGLEPAVAVYRRHGPLLRAIAEAAASDPDLARGHAAMRGRFEQLNESFLRDAQRRGSRPLADVSETARAMTVISEAYLLDAYGREPRVPVEVAVQTLSEIWLALTAPEGRTGAAPTEGSESGSGD
ncbi:MAG: TetR/AcrR family transcriptional regulator [Solirubrobacterales bacterium]